MFKSLQILRSAKPEDQVKVLKTAVYLLSAEVLVLSAVSRWAMEQQTKQYRLLAQQYDILAKYANWEDPMIKHEMQTLLEFRKIVDPPKDED